MNDHDERPRRSDGSKRRGSGVPLAPSENWSLFTRHYCMKVDLCHSVTHIKLKVNFFALHKVACCCGSYYVSNPEHLVIGGWLGEIGAGCRMLCFRRVLVNEFPLPPSVTSPVFDSFPLAWLVTVSMKMHL